MPSFLNCFVIGKLYFQDGVEHVFGSLCCLLRRVQVRMFSRLLKTKVKTNSVHLLFLLELRVCNDKSVRCQVIFLKTLPIYRVNGVEGTDASLSIYRSRSTCWYSFHILSSICRKVLLHLLKLLPPVSFFVESLELSNKLQAL